VATFPLFFLNTRAAPLPCGDRSARVLCLGHLSFCVFVCHLSFPSVFAVVFNSGIGEGERAFNNDETSRENWRANVDSGQRASFTEMECSPLAMEFLRYFCVFELDEDYFLEN
jgi:hypothetical protein